MPAFKRICAALLLASSSHASAADIQIAGKLFVDMRAADSSSSSGVWKNAGELGDFEKVGDPKVVDIGGVKAMMLNAGKSNDAWRCKDTAPTGIVGKSPTRTVEVWVYNPEVAFEEPMVAFGKRGGPPGTAYNFNYGTAPGHGAITHWGGADLGWGQVPTAAKWHHLVHTYDGQTNRVYSDGELIASEKLRPNDIQTHAGSRVTIGTGIRADHEPEFGTIRASLAIAIVRIHDGVLTAEQILNNFLVDSAQLGLIADPGNLRFPSRPSLEAFTTVDGQLTYTAEIGVFGLPLPTLAVMSPSGAKLERLSPQRHRLSWTLPEPTPRRIQVHIVAKNASDQKEAKWIARVAPISFRTKLLAIDTNECCDVADFNNDGQLDVVAGRNWYAGPDFAPRPLRPIGEFGRDYSNNNGDHAWDVNGDGWTDVIAGSFKETQVFWFENPGREGLDFGKQWKTHLLTDTQEGENELTFFRDLDHDGIPEYVVNSWNNSRAMLGWKLRPRKDGVGLEKLEFGPPGKNHNGHGMGFGDINGDGLNDIVFESGWYERPAKNAFKRNWKLHADWHFPGSSCPIIVRDLNKDGRNDMIIGRGHDYGLMWLEQLAPTKTGSTQWLHHQIDKSFSQAHALHWGDLDGDGQGELVTGKRVRAHSGGDPGAGDVPNMYFYRWNDAREAFTRYTIGSGRIGTGLQIRDADMNNDGRTDLIVAGKSGTFVVFNEGSRISHQPSEQTSGLELRDGDRVVMIGGGWIERDQRNGIIESVLTAAFPDKKLEFRNLGWVGDTVYGHARAPGRTGSVFGNAEQGFANLLKQVRDAKPTVLIVGYGQNESFDGSEGAASFREATNRLLGELIKITSRIIVVSPHRPDVMSDDDVERKQAIATYAKILEDESKKRSLPFVNLLTLPRNQRLPLTERFGTSLTDTGYQLIARRLLGTVSVPEKVFSLELDGDQMVSEQGIEVLSMRRWDHFIRLDFRSDRLLNPDDAILVNANGLVAQKYNLIVDGQIVRQIEVPQSGKSFEVRFVGRQVRPLTEAWSAFNQAVVYKNRLFFHSWRPRNTAFITGERKSEQQPSHGDVPRFLPLVIKAERKISRLKQSKTHTLELQAVKSAK